MNIKTYEEYRIAFSEVNYIIKNSNIELQNKISKSFLSMIENNMNRNYIINFNLDDGLDKCNLQKKTKSILKLIYKTYLCSEEEKQKISEEEKIYKETIEEKYSYNSLFKKEKNKDIGGNGNFVENDTVELIPYNDKKSFFTRFFQKLKKFLKGDRK